MERLCLSPLTAGEEKGTLATDDRMSDRGPAGSRWLGASASGHPAHLADVPWAKQLDFVAEE